MVMGPANEEQMPRRKKDKGAIPESVTQQKQMMNGIYETARMAVADQSFPARIRMNDQWKKEGRTALGYAIQGATDSGGRIMTLPSPTQAREFARVLQIELEKLIPGNQIRIEVKGSDVIATNVTEYTTKPRTVVASNP